MPWYIPIVTALIGFAGGWVTRWHFDRRASRDVLYLEVLAKYISRTEEEHADVNSFRMHALQWAGALRLTDGEFERLLSDARNHGKPLPEDDPFFSPFSVREILALATKHQIEISKAHAIHEWILRAHSRLEDKGQSVNKHSLTQELESQDRAQ